MIPFKPITNTFRAKIVDTIFYDNRFLNSNLDPSIPSIIKIIIFRNVPYCTAYIYLLGCLRFF